MKNKIAYILPLRIILFISSFLFLALFSGQQVQSLTKWWSIVASFCNILTIIILLLLCRKENTTYIKMMRYKKGTTKILEVILFSIVVLLVGIGGMYLAGILCYKQFPYLAVTLIEPIPLWIAVGNMFILPITTTLAEDGLYLGYAINRIDNKWAAILMPAIFYSIQHSFIPLIFNIQYMTYRFLSFLPLTLLMCYWYYKKRNPVPLMSAHLIINLATVIQIVITSALPDVFQIMNNI